MDCPKCGQENPDDAQSCSSCDCALTDKRPEVRVSRMAIASIVCTLCGLALLAPSLVAVNLPRLLSPRLEWVGWTFFVSLVILGASFILGLISVIRIERSGGRITGRAFAVGAVLISAFGGMLPAWSIVVHRPRSTAFRMVCGTNLSGIGKAMLIYSNDYDDEFPRAGGKSSVWTAKIPDWKADNRLGAYDLDDDGSGGRASISSSFYLLVKYAEVEPIRFVCTKDSGTTEFKPGRFRTPGKKLVDLWDLGPEPWKHCSYSYHMLYGPYPLTISSDPGMAVAADRNPWIASPFIKAKKDFSKFDPDGAREAVKAGNAVAHQGDGQNVLFLDSHVGFEKRSFCGVNDDNIYTYWDGEDITKGSVPTLGSQPADRLDSLLVHDPPVTNR